MFIDEASKRHGCTPTKTIAKVLRAIDEGIREIVSELELDVDASLSVSDTRMATLSNLQEKMSQWCDSTEQLSHYRSTMSRIEMLQQRGLGEVSKDATIGRISAGQIESRLRFLQSEAILARAWSERTDLAEFHGQTYEQMRERFAELDQQRIALSRLEIACEHHEQLPNGSASGGQMNILQREINKKRRHLPLRRLLKEAGQARHTKIVKA